MGPLDITRSDQKSSSAVASGAGSHVSKTLDEVTITAVVAY